MRQKQFKQWLNDEIYNIDQDLIQTPPTKRLEVEYLVGCRDAYLSVIKHLTAEQQVLSPKDTRDILAMLTKNREDRYVKETM